MPDETLVSSINREFTSRIVAAYVRLSKSDPINSRPSSRPCTGARRSRQTATRNHRRADTRDANPAIRSRRLCRLPRMRLARPDAQTASQYRPWIDRGAVLCSLEPATRARVDRTRLLGTALRSGEADQAWAGTQRIPRRRGAARNRNPGSTATAISATRKAATRIGFEPVVSHAKALDGGARAADSHRAWRLGGVRA
jgi:hypothetical protein